MKRLGNLGVVTIAVVVGVGAFILLQVIAAAQRPDIVDIIAAAHDLNVGDMIAADDLIIKTVYEDDLVNLYILAGEENTVIGGTVAIAHIAGQPIMRNGLIALSGVSSRLSAILTAYPGDYVLYPLPMDAANLVAPDISSFVTGDLVNITAVISTRPMTMEQLLPGTTTYGEIVTPTPEATESEAQDAIDRSEPPLSKSIFPEGVRVIEVQGLPPNYVPASDMTQNDTSSVSTTYVDYNQPKFLILLVPQNKVELLSLVLQESDLLVVTLLASGSVQPTTGYTYWDLEEWFKSDRQEILGGGEQP